MALRRPRSDAALLARIADGDAFSTFCRRHLDGVIAFHRRRVPTPELAFDLAAETFAAVVIAAGDYRGDGPAVGWLYGVARGQDGREGRVVRLRG